MKLSGRNVKSPITLLPVDPFQRELLSGISGALIWFVATFWGYWTPYQGNNWWNLKREDPLLESVAYHLQESTRQVLISVTEMYSPIRNIINVTDAFFTVLPTVLSLALAAVGVVMLLSAFKIVSYPAKLRWFGPVALGALVLFMLFVAIVVPPFTAITSVAFPLYKSYPPEFSLNVGDWVGFIIEMVAKLAVPTAAVVLGLVPIFAPVKKDR